MAHVSVKTETTRLAVVGTALIALTAAAFLTALGGCDNAQETDSNGAAMTPSRARWHNNQGVVYMDQHNYARASDEFNKAIALSPTYASGLTNLGIAYFSLGQYDSAAVSLQNALRIDPAQLNAHYTLGLIYNAQGREHEKALRGFERVLQADPDDPLLRYYLGQAKIKLDRPDEGMAEFREAIRLDPTNVSAHYALANQLRRQGRQEEWQEVLSKFTELSQAGHEGISASYQGQGKYAEVVADVEISDPGSSDSNGPIRFTPVATTARDNPIAFATMADLDADQLPELVTGGRQPVAYRLDSGTFSASTDTGFSFPVTGSWNGANFGDWDNDGDQDLVLTGQASTSLENDGSVWQPGIEFGAASRAVFADVDHDGDLDLMVLRASSVALYSNDGFGRFSEITQAAGFAGTGSVRRALFTDFDNDRDIDVLLLGQGGSALFTNNRDGTFVDVAETVGLGHLDAVDIVVEDMDRDGFMDVIALTATGFIVELRNRRGRSFVEETRVEVESYLQLMAADLDNDGDQDLLAYGTAGILPLARYRGHFESQERLKQASALPETGHLLIEDLDGDGALDVWSENGQWSNASDAGGWLTIRLAGLNSNRDAVGTKVEVKTASHQQKLEVRGGSGDARGLHFGLAREDSVEFIRVLWPGGVRQTELATHGRRTLTLKELDRKGTSCPILYVWDGERFRFETDILGGGIIGYLVSQGEYYTPDTDEYVPLGRVEPLDGEYVLQIANQLEEIIYLDAVELIAIDHDSGVSMLPNERLLSAPPYPDFQLFPLVKLRPPLAATDAGGRDILGAIREVDDVWPEGFEKTAIHGYVSDHHMVLDLGDLSAFERPVLVGHGWVDYAHSTSNWAAAQQGLNLYPPRLEVPDDEGNWIVALADMGTPAGLPKKMVVELSGLFTNDDHRVRISTNSAVYWDQLLVGERVESPHEVVRIGNAGSNLHWRGYPRHTAINGTFAFRYDYDDLILEADWGTHAGSFTRFGEVGELLEVVDDRYVIMYHGDELTVRFDADALAPVAKGRTRSFMLYADGFGKDMDLHSAHSLTVTPLPFHAMSTYPYPADENYPQDAEHSEYVLNYNTRRVRGYYE